jgi:transposase
MKGVDDALRVQIIEEHLAGSSQYSLARKYKLSNGRSISAWMRTFGIAGSEKQAEPEEGMQKRKADLNKSSEVISLEKENRLLRLGLARAQMKAETLDAIIDLAEETYQIKIRKNSNTK